MDATTYRWTIRNHETGETIHLHRDVCTSHPDWVHRQCGYDPECGMGREVALQAMLDQISSADYKGRGRDECGIGLEDY